MISLTPCFIFCHGACIFPSAEDDVASPAWPAPRVGLGGGTAPPPARVEPSFGCRASSGARRRRTRTGSSRRSSPPRFRPGVTCGRLTAPAEASSPGARLLPTSFNRQCCRVGNLFVLLLAFFPSVRLIVCTEIGCCACGETIGGRTSTSSSASSVILRLGLEGYFGLGD